MKLSFFVLILTLLTGCVSNEGTFHVLDRLYVDSDTIEKDIYNLSIKVRKPTKMTLALKSENANHKFSLRFPKNKPLPEFNINKIHESYQNCILESKCTGQNAGKTNIISYEASELNIDYNLRGALNINHKKSLKYDDNEPCTIVPNLNECRYYRNHGSNSNSMCRGVPGTRKSSFILHQYELSLILRFLELASLENSAFLTSSKTKTFKEYIYKGTCFPENTNNY